MWIGKQTAITKLDFPNFKDTDLDLFFPPRMQHMQLTCGHEKSIEFIMQDSIPVCKQPIYCFKCCMRNESNQNI